MDTSVLDPSVLREPVVLTSATLNGNFAARRDNRFPPLIICMELYPIMSNRMPVFPEIFVAPKDMIVPS